MSGGMLAGLANRLRSRDKLRDAWRLDIKSEGERVRRDVREALVSDIKRLRAEQVQLTKTVASLQTALAEALDRMERAERRSTRTTLRHRLDEKHRALTDRLSSVLDPDHVALHVRDAITRAELQLDPFPHMVVDEVVPPEVYALMLRSIPPVEFFGERDPIKQNLRIPAEDAPELTKQVWDFFDGVVSREAIVPAVIQRFEAPLRAHYATVFGPAWVDRAAALSQSPAGGRVMLRRPGYHLSPHRDPKRSMLTCLMYLAAPGDDEAYGTKIFRVSDDQESSYTQTYYPEQNGARCELTKTVPFRPNSMLVFINGTGAHGADIPADAPADLERYSYQFYVGPSSEALAALIEELPADRREKWRDKRAVTAD